MSNNEFSLDKVSPTFKLYGEFKIVKIKNNDIPYVKQYKITEGDIFSVTITKKDVNKYGQVETIKVTNKTKNISLNKVMMVPFHKALEKFFEIEVLGRTVGEN